MESLTREAMDMNVYMATEVTMYLGLGRQIQPRGWWALCVYGDAFSYKRDMG